MYALENTAPLYCPHPSDPNLPFPCEIHQPGLYDTLDFCEWERNNIIAHLSDYVPIVFCDFYPDCLPNEVNVVDAAIAVSSTELIGNATPCGGYGRPKSITVQPSVGMDVKKYGRTTGLTTGRISSINATVDVQYESGVARFVNQIIIGPSITFSAAGDSGSLIVVNGGMDDRKPVGLLFAGSSLYTIANPINAVLAAFPGLTVDGEP